MNAPPAYEQLLPLEAVATQLHVSVRTVRRLIRVGALVAYRLRRNLVRVDAKSVTRLLEESRIGPSLEAASCRGENEDTSQTSRTSVVNAGSPSSGRRGSTGAKSRSAPPMRKKPSDDSSLSPRNAADLKEMVRRLRHPS